MSPERRRKNTGNLMEIETYRATFRQPVIAGHQIKVRIKDPIEVELYQAGRGWKARNVKNGAEYPGLSAAMLNSQKTAVEALFEEKLIDWQPYDKHGRPSIPQAASA